MKKIFTLVFIVFIQIVTGQNITAPTGTSTEVGETAGQLSVSLTGAATYSIPIQVPPGLNGVVPQLSLNYSSQSGNGIAGYGWNIGGLSAITRIPSTKFHDGTDDPVDFDALDRFALDGQRLIVKTGTTGIYGANNTVYETENFSNVKVTSFGVHPSGASYGPAWFKVEYPDGSVAEYGNGTGVVARSLMTWAIKKWENPQAVSILYDYTLTSNILEIEKIHYGSISATTHMNHIEFNYKSRQRSEQYYIAGQNFENLKILSVINIVGFRKYLLTQEITPIKYEKLVGITEKNEDETLSLNPIVFEYDNDVFDSTSIDSKQSYTLNTSITATHKSLTGDFDGDGNSDFIFYKKSVKLATYIFLLFV